MTLSSHLEEGTGPYSVRNASDLGAAIQDARCNAGLSHHALSEQAGVSRTYLSHVERGRSSRLIDLLRVLDLELTVRRRNHDASHRAMTAFCARHEVAGSACCSGCP